jgi:hypothetical protein
MLILILFDDTTFINSKNVLNEMCEEIIKFFKSMKLLMFSTFQSCVPFQLLILKLNVSYL